jgi:hypothetical protein
LRIEQSAAIRFRYAEHTRHALLMPPKLGNYLISNLKGQAPEQSRNPSADLAPAFGELNEQTIVLRREDIRSDVSGAPELDWSTFDQGEIVLQLKDTEGILEGNVTVKASTLQRIHPALLPVQLDADYLFPVSLRTVVLQVQANLNQRVGEVLKPNGQDFDTPIAQIAREDDGFFKLEKLAQAPPAPNEHRAEKKRPAAEPALTPADRPSFPWIRKKLAAENTESEPAMARGPLFGPRRSEDLEARGAPVEKAGLSARRSAQKPVRKMGLERLQEIFMTEDLLDGWQVAKLVTALPKVKGALIMFGDGTLLGGELPEDCHPDSARLAPGMMRTVQEFSHRLKSSESPACTIFSDPPVSVFLEGNVCILIAHERRGLLPGMLERIGETARALDALYAAD